MHQGEPVYPHGRGGHNLTQLAHGHVAKRVSAWKERPVDSREEFAMIIQREPWLARLHYLPDPEPSRWRPVESVVALALLVSPWILFVWGLYGWLRL